HQAMLVAGHPGGMRVTLMDGDIVSPANCVRQPFSSAEIGLAKAVVMVSRLNLFWGLSWTASPEFLSEHSKISDFDVVIGCVDTRAARIVIAWHVQGLRSRVAYWPRHGQFHRQRTVRTWPAVERPESALDGSSTDSSRDLP
ncbi:MAG: ThiF family adenylyltransferase, partial [Bryobacteraceae bacterium]